MKKILFFAASLLCCILLAVMPSCKKESINSPTRPMRITLPDDVISYYEENYGIEAGAAYQSALYAFSKLYPERYSQFIDNRFDCSMEFYTLNTIRSICSTFPSNDNDTLMYVINFSNNNGYILVTDSLDILAISENTNIYLSDFTTDITDERFNNRPPKWTIIGSVNDKMISKAEIYRRIGHGLQYIHPIDSIRAEIQNLDSIGPFVKMELSQKEPYNLYCPTDIYNQHALAGCVPIALVHWFSTTGYPQFLQYGSTWEEIVSDWEYHHSIGDSIHYNILEDAKLDALNQIISEVGQRIGVNYGTDGTGCIIDRSDNNPVTVYLRNNGYQNALLINIDSATCHQILMDGKPLFVRGTRYNEAETDGHAWIFDGLTWYDTYTYTYRHGHRTTEIKHQELIHCNFGWGGKYNDYYNINIFIPSFTELWEEPDDEIFFTRNVMIYKY